MWFSILVFRLFQLCSDSDSFRVYQLADLSVVRKPVDMATIQSKVQTNQVCDCLCRVHMTVFLHDNLSPLFPLLLPLHPPPPYPHPLLILLPLILLPQYASVEQLFEDLNLLFDSTCLAYPKESPLYKVSHAAIIRLPLQ